MSDEIHVFRVWNPEAMDVWPLGDLFDRACANAVHHADPDEARRDFRDLVPAGTVAILVARLGTEYRGLCMIGLPHRMINKPYASIIYFYSEGPKVLSNELIKAVAKLAADEGYGSLGLINGNGRDAAFERLVKPFLGIGERLGTAYRFDLAGESDE